MFLYCAAHVQLSSSQHNKYCSTAVHKYYKGRRCSIAVLFAIVHYLAFFYTVLYFGFS